MSNADEEVAALGQHARRTARVEGLRRKMIEYVDSVGKTTELEDLRAGVDSMSDLVDESRRERL